MDQLSFDPRVTLDKCVRVYGLIWTGYAHALRAARRHALARQVAAHGVHGAFNRKHGEAIVTQLCARFPTRLPR